LNLLGRHHPIVFANETHGFVLGGTTVDENANNDFFMYDEAINEWVDLTFTSSGFPGTPRSFGYGVVRNQALSSKAYLGFGASATGENLNDFWEFDMETHEWTQLASLPGLGRRHPSMVPVYLKDSDAWEIHVGLGDGYDADNQFSNFNDYWVYDVTTDMWTEVPNFPSSKRHHPFFFGIGPTSYVGLGHSDGREPYIERDFFSYDTKNNEWRQEPDFASYLLLESQERALVTTKARVAGTEFSIDLPLVGANSSELRGSIGFILSGDGDDHGSMSQGEFHAFYPEDAPSIADTSASPSRNVGGEAWRRQLPPHPGGSRWAPGSFVMRGTASVYFCCGYDRATGILHDDVWMMDLSLLFVKSSSENDSITDEADTGEGNESDNSTTSNASDIDSNNGNGNYFDNAMGNELQNGAASSSRPSLTLCHFVIGFFMVATMLHDFWQW